MLQTKILGRLGIESLRPFQEAVLEQLLAGTDALCIAPTSAGKSVIFQALALQREQLVIVIEPHLALELDQVRQMHERGIAAATINGLLPPADKQQVLEQIASGQLRLLYVTPEMLQNIELKQTIKECKIAGVMVDEAHCIVKQGSGFREDYLRIKDFVAGLPERPVVAAFTATATMETADEIAVKLALRAPYIHRIGVTRDNILLRVIEVGQGLGGRKDAEVIEQRKREEIVALLRKCKTGRVVIYSNTVKRVEKLYKFLEKSGFSVACYHGKRKNKMEILQDFQNGKQRIMVCTNAFGLGVNIPDIRLVIHHAPLIGLDDYTQEVGRAGRDGKKSKAVLLWHSYDFTICERLIRKNALDLTGKELKQRLAALHALQAYAQTEDRCRWQMIREFFGEQPGKRCKKRCDYCKRK